MTQVRISLADLVPADRNELESHVVAFDLNWRPHALRAAIDRMPDEAPWNWAAVVEMVKVDLERNWRAGRRPTLAEYLTAVPELGAAADLPASLIAAEYQLREELDDAADFTEVLRRYPAQADELQQLVNGPPEDGISHQNTHRTLPQLVPGPALIDDPFPGGTFGRYRILKKLGAGGMGAVYLAHDPRLQRDVALKIPSAELTADPRAVELVLQEARAAAALRHPNICPVYDAGVIDDTPFITSLYIEGEPLSALAKRAAPISQVEAAKIVATVARALAHAHHAGIIHRDLKPSNIMLDRNGQPVVTDFGLARRVQADMPTLATMSGPAGSPAYMAPEQYAETKAGPASDIFSLGVVLYELLAGRVPFQGSPSDVFRQLMDRECPSPSRFRPDIDHRLEAACLKALAKNPHDRHQSMDELAAALEAVSARPSRRWRYAVAAGALLVLVGAAAVIADPFGARGKGDSGQAQAGPTETDVGIGKPTVPPVVVPKVVPKTGAFDPAFKRARGYNPDLYDPPKFKGEKPTTQEGWIKAINDPDESNRYLAVLTSAESGYTDAVPALAKRMALKPGTHSKDEEHWAVRRECAAAIGHLGKGRQLAEEALFARIADEYWLTRRKITIREDRWRNPFQDGFMQDPDHGGKGAALEALKTIAPNQVTKALDNAKTSPNADVKSWAERELIEWKKDPRAALNP